MGFLDFLGAPLKGIMDGVSGIIDSINAPAEDKLKAQQSLVAMQADFHLKLAELDTEWAKTQADVIKTEASSQSWMARNWRPILMLSFTYIIVHTYIIVPIFSIHGVDLPPDMWALLKLGMGGYVMGRTVEKVAPDIVAAIKGGNSSKEED